LRIKLDLISKTAKEVFFLARQTKGATKFVLSQKDNSTHTTPSQHAGATKTEKNVTTNRQKVVKMPKTYRKWSHVSFTFKLLRWEPTHSHMHTHARANASKAL